MVVPATVSLGTNNSPVLGLYRKAPVSSKSPSDSLWKTTGKFVFAVLSVTVAFDDVPVTSPTKAVEVMLVAPVTTPASTLIVPSNKIADHDAGSMLIAAPESKVRTPAESISTVPSAVI